MTLKVSKFIDLGIKENETSVLQWYLACLHPNGFKRIEQDVLDGRELINPIDAFERMIRNGVTSNYKECLGYAMQCLRDSEMSKTAAKWILLWEPQLQKHIKRVMLGSTSEYDVKNDVEEKRLGYALLATHMMARNWGHPSIMQKWAEKLIEHQQDISDEKINNNIAKTYWRIIFDVAPEYREIVWDGLMSRTKKINSLIPALEFSKNNLIMRRDNIISLFEDPVFSKNNFDKSRRIGP